MRFQLAKVRLTINLSNIVNELRAVAAAIAHRNRTAVDHGPRSHRIDET
jgi:hypothetical protein